MMYKNIFDYIVQNETAYKLPITISDGWDWSMSEHLKTSFFYKFGRLLTGNTDTKPVKNIVRPIINLAYRAEDIDLKEVMLYVDDPSGKELSFLIKKYHDEVFIKENDLDTFFDETKEEKIDFGGALVQKVNGARPMKVPLQSIVFCDQTNILSAPIGIKLFYSPSELKAMESKGWGSKKYGATATIDEVILLAQNNKKLNKEGQEVKTPGKYVEIYQVCGDLPNFFLTGDYDEEKYTRQLHFVTFLSLANGEKTGITLFKIEDREERFKFINRDAVYNRALGFGGVEELFESQVWTNYGMIRKKDFLDAASKVILKTTDSAFAQRNKVGEMENLEVAVLEEGKDISQIDTFPRNFQLFEKAVDEWAEYGKSVGAAYDPAMGKEPVSGTPFASLSLQVQQGLSLHEYRRGKYARFIEEIYQDWIIPEIVKKITNGTRFLAELSADEMEYVAEGLKNNLTEKWKVEKILNGEIIDEQMIEEHKMKVKEDFMKGGNKVFFEILKGELKKTALKVKVNVAGKKADLAIKVEKLSNVFRQIFANPQILDDPRASKIFSKILEYSGLSPLDFQTTLHSTTNAKELLEVIK